MTEYQKKPITIQAYQMTKERRWHYGGWPEWLRDAFEKEGEGSVFIDPTDPKGEDLMIRTLEGDLRIGWGDYIIRGAFGELYPCKPDIFEWTYERPKDSIIKQLLKVAEAALDVLLYLPDSRGFELNHLKDREMRCGEWCWNALCPYCQDAVKEVRDKLESALAEVEWPERKKEG